jgi:hypothetical protein
MVASALHRSSKEASSAHAPVRRLSRIMRSFCSRSLPPNRAVRGIGQPVFMQAPGDRDSGSKRRAPRAMTAGRSKLPPNRRRDPAHNEAGDWERPARASEVAPANRCGIAKWKASAEEHAGLDVREKAKSSQTRRLSFAPRFIAV